MFLRAWRFLTIMLTALSMGVSLCHLFEMPSKMVMAAPLWLMLLQTMHTQVFGTFGIWFEIGAVASAIILTLSLRHRWPAYPWTLLATLCLIATHASFWMLIDPINKELMPLTPQTLPEDWQDLRDKWEFTHAARAGLQVVALAALVVSALAEIPRGFAGHRSMSKWLDQRERR